MSEYLNPDMVARDVANAFCQHYVSSLSPKQIDSVREYKEATIIYASAYDEAYNYIIEQNQFVKNSSEM